MRLPDGACIRFALCCAFLGGLGSGVRAQESNPEPPKGGAVGSAKAPSKPLDGASEGLKGTNAAQTPADRSATGDTATGKGKRAGGAAGKDGDGKPEKTAYDYELPGANGKGMPLAGFRDKVLLVVNVGRMSSYNAQLAALEKLQQTYKDKGLIVIGVPSNDFGAAEPGTDAEVLKAYTDAKVSFPVTPRSSLIGVQELPFFLYLTKGKAVPEGGNVHWNYTKFLLDRKGKVVARFGPEVEPDSPELISTLDQVLSGRFKPHKDEKPTEGGDEDGDDGP